MSQLRVIFHFTSQMLYNTRSAKPLIKIFVNCFSIKRAVRIKSPRAIGMDYRSQSLEWFGSKRRAYDVIPLRSRCAENNELRFHTDGNFIFLYSAPPLEIHPKMFLSQCEKLTNRTVKTKTSLNILPR